MDIKAAQIFLGKKVRVYPGDTYKKTAEVIAIDDTGITFKVLSYNGSDNEWQVGKLRYISFSSKLSMEEI